MFKKKVVFVIGAGANEDVNLPFGDKFKEIISDKLKFNMQHGMKTTGDSHIYEAIDAHAQNSEGPKDRNPYLSASRMLSNAIIGASSIDEYLSNKKAVSEVSFCGKLAISSTILEAERGSLLYYDRGMVGPEILSSRLNKSWYPFFWQLLHKNIDDESLENIFKNITLIIFNYDRCVEHYLLSQIQIHYGVSEERAFEILKTLEIFHPFGTVGELPMVGVKNPIAFGGRFNRFDLIRISQGISTFHEKMGNFREIDKIRTRIKTAEAIVYLGFAFHTQNLDLLKPFGKLKQKSIFGTGVGISPSEKEIILNQLEEKQFGFKKHIQIHLDKDCANLFKEKRADFSTWK